MDRLISLIGMSLAQPCTHALDQVSNTYPTLMLQIQSRRQLPALEGCPRNRVSVPRLPIFKQARCFCSASTVKAPQAPSTHAALTQKPRLSYVGIADARAASSSSQGKHWNDLTISSISSLIRSLIFKLWRSGECQHSKSCVDRRHVLIVQVLPRLTFEDRARDVHEVVL